MNFTEYQTKSRATAKYPVIGHGVIYPTLGLTNEAGEVAGKIKKVFRDKDGIISDETREALKAELGDVLWYLSQTATELGLSSMRLPNTTSPNCWIARRAAKFEAMAIIADRNPISASREA